MQEQVSAHIPNADSIVMFLHCAKCFAEKPPDLSPMEWSRTQTGFTKLGIQVWCNRHHCNIVHIDFEGQKHPANIKAEGANGNT